MKTRLTLVIGLAAALAGAAGASAAAAADVSVTYQGVIDATDAIGLPMPDADTADLFGGGNLEGDNITAVFNYDTNLGMEATDGATYDQLSGGSAFYDQTTNTSYASPITSEVFTINGYSYTFTPDYYATVYTQSGAYGGINQIGDSIDGTESYVYLPTSDAPASLGTSYSNSSSFGSGYLLTALNADNLYDNIVFTTTSVVVSAAPEPSVWLLMLAGVGLIGGLLRRGKRQGELALAV
ncbi:MAG: PEP-CTERM sorting domain-containing protein [Caulobacteraceae bacterium]